MSNKLLKIEIFKNQTIYKSTKSIKILGINLKKRRERLLE